jgi:hypothetical protein
MIVRSGSAGDFPMTYLSRHVRILVVIAVAGYALACGGSSEPTSLGFVEHEVERSADGCEPGGPDCAWVKLRWLEAGDGTEEARAAVDAWIVAHVLEPLGDHWIVNTPEDVATAMLADRAEFVAEFPDAASAGWYLEREVRRLPAPEGMVSLEFTERQYTGGAHGMESVRLATFRTSDGALLGLDDLVPADGRAAFQESADAAFRASRGLGPDEDLGGAGFFIEGNHLPPTDNVARVREGIRLRYDAYEIAPYSLGPTDLTVPR